MLDIKMSHDRLVNIVPYGTKVFSKSECVGCQGTGLNKNMYVYVWYLHVQDTQWTQINTQPYRGCFPVRFRLRTKTLTLGINSNPNIKMLTLLLDLTFES